MEKQIRYVAQSLWLQKKEKAIVVLLPSLNDNEKAEKAVAKLKVTDLNVDDGFDKLIAKIDKTFKTEKTKDSYNVYVDFNKFFSNWKYEH